MVKCWQFPIVQPNTNIRNYKTDMVFINGREAKMSCDASKLVWLPEEAHLAI